MTPSKIVLHHSLTKDSETVSWNAIREYHTKVLGWRDIGYHYGIEALGNRVNILTGRMMNEAGAHCRDSGMNRLSLGICFVGNFDEKPPNSVTLIAGLRLVRSLMAVFDIAADDVSGHCEYAEKTCPGNLFDLDAFRGQLK